ncbi:MAG: hypothetical protein KGJ78_10245 [Alphaproteobacteria bacterium]|nr:hypothetical protein [Alphaproteobacteria bacterium]
MKYAILLVATAFALFTRAAYASSGDDFLGCWSIAGPRATLMFQILSADGGYKIRFVGKDGRLTEDTFPLQTMSEEGTDNFEDFLSEVLPGNNTIHILHGLESGDDYASDGYLAIAKLSDAIDAPRHPKWGRSAYYFQANQWGGGTLYRVACTR